MKNIIGKDEVFEGKLSYAYIVNAPIFYKVPYYPNGKYLSSYIDVWRLHANANYEWQINDLVGVHASANYFNYDTIVSNKENINGSLGVSLNLDEKIKMNTSVSYLGKRRSVGGLQDSLQNYHINYNDIFDLNHQLHANISIDYNYTKSISAYLRINNIFNSKQDMWEGYQEIGRNAWFGLSYSF
ncbi:MAG: TonB-dependent receptor [Flavobacteriales bacterium]|nr:TonB-dependent receptor [Flavobacteriales bacterium]